MARQVRAWAQRVLRRVQERPARCEGSIAGVGGLLDDHKVFNESRL